jgi:hypothetical protein
VHTPWNNNEGTGSGTTSGTFTDTYGQLAAANWYYANTTPASLVSLTVSPIDTVGVMLPGDLAGTPFDNATVITRFKKYVDWLATMLPGTTFTSIQIGNEMDVPAAAGTAAYWSQYKTFLHDVVPYVKSKFPGVKVGFTVTAYGALGQGTNGATKQAGILSLLEETDLIGITYYPITLNPDATFSHKNPSVVIGEIDDLVAAIPTKPIYIQEAGYSTSSACGGSEAAQADFVSSVFTAWDAHASRIPFISFLRINDLSNADATSTAAAYGLPGNASFIAYLETLGLRSYAAPSSYKDSWSRLTAETAARGW